jgi:hypothetical protein
MSAQQDLLNLSHINSLPQPFVVRLLGDKDFNWPLWDIDVETGMLRIDVCGKLDVKHISDVSMFRDDAGREHTPDSFYLEDEPACTDCGGSRACATRPVRTDGSEGH